MINKFNGSINYSHYFFLNIKHILTTYYNYERRYYNMDNTNKNIERDDDGFIILKPKAGFKIPTSREEFEAWRKKNSSDKKSDEKKEED